MVRRARISCGVSLLVLVLSPGVGSAQASPADSMEIRREAERAQSRFERERRRRAPAVQGGWGGRCDEIVGRICLRIQSGSDWWPEPEPRRIVEARARLLTRLDGAGDRLPGDLWIRGQRVAYLLEDGEDSRALEASRGCPERPVPECLLLEGLVLHRAGRFLEAEAVFGRALEALAPEEATRLRDPRILLDRDGRSLLDDTEEAGARSRLVRRAWAFADPLYLVPGNDRWTEHMARHALVYTRREAANPYALSWGDDLEQVLVRYGWEWGWERVEPQSATLADMGQALGHQHPENRPYLPPGRALERLHETTWEEWNPGSRYFPRTGYAPAYAPVILPAEAKTGRIPLGDSVRVVVTLALPRDTSFHRAHDHETDLSPEDRETREVRGVPSDGATASVGLFALDPDGALVADTRRPGLGATVALTLPAGDYLLSAEVWAPDSARAGRHREGFRYVARPRDLPSISDLFVIPPDREPRTLDELVAAVAPESAAVGSRFRVAWALYGFGFTRETVEYRLQIRRAPGGFLRRAGRFLGLISDDEAVSLSWSEAAPEDTGVALRSAEIQLPADLEAGEYRIRLELRSPGRERMVVERRLVLGSGGEESPR